MGCTWEAPFLWLGGGLPSGFPTSWLMMGKVTCSIIFGNEHVNALGKEAGSQHFGFIRTILKWEGPCRAAGPVS